METPSTDRLPGIYQYTYPTFVDTPQYICVHFLTPDGLQAFVSYPYRPNRKAAQLIPLSWFESVVLIRLEGQPYLMQFLEVLLTGWSGNQFVKRPAAKVLLTTRTAYGYSGLLTIS